MIETAPARAAIRDDQLRQLRALIAAIVPGNRFYAPRLANAGITASLASLDEFSARMPFTTKQELAEDQIAHPPYGSVLTFPLDRYTRFAQTSGTTRAPIRWLDTNESWAWMVGNWRHVFDAAGVGRGDRVLFAFSFGPFLGFWLAFECAATLGCLCIPGGGLGSDARLRMLIDNDANVLCCTPTYAIRLAESAAEAGIDLRRARVKTIIVAGEPGGSIPAVRQRIEALWSGARVIDHHGMTEVGPVSYPSPTHADSLCVIEASYLAEVIDPATGKPAREGEIGELVLTNLGRTGSPLLRYRTGDLVKPVWPARGDLTLVGGIIGRSDDMVVVRSVNVFPSAVDQVMRSHADVAEYRVEVFQERGMTELRMQVEPVASCVDGPGLLRKLEHDLRGAIALRIPLSLMPVGSLPRFEMKAKRWVRS